MFSFNFSPNHIPDKEKLRQLAKNHTDLYYNEHEFVNSLFEFLSGEKKKFNVGYHPLNRLNINNNHDVNLPIYKIQKYSFICKDNLLMNYDLLIPKIELLTAWAGNLDWCKYSVEIDSYDWYLLLKQIFTEGKHFDIKELSERFNYIEFWILQNDKHFLYELNQLKNAKDVSNLILEFLNGRFNKDSYLNNNVDHIIKLMPEQIKVVCPDKLNQYNSCLELLISPTRWKKMGGIRIEDRPIYNFLLSNINKDGQPENNSLRNDNLAIQVFENNGHELFEYLNKNYTRDNKYPKAKYSYIYHFLVYNQFIRGDQDLYIKFIVRFSGKKLSKIQPTNDKYKYTIQPTLNDIFIEYKKK